MKKSIIIQALYKIIPLNFFKGTLKGILKINIESVVKTPSYLLKRIIFHKLWHGKKTFFCRLYCFFPLLSLNDFFKIIKKALSLIRSFFLGIEERKTSLLRGILLFLSCPRLKCTYENIIRYSDKGKMSSRTKDFFMRFLPKTIYFAYYRRQIFNMCSKHTIIIHHRRQVFFRIRNTIQ